MAELLTYFEVVQARGEAIPTSLLRTAALLLAKLGDLVCPAPWERIEELASHLKTLNRHRRQAAHWTPEDWRRLARLVLENRHLSTWLYFAPDPPFAWDRERELELPYCARYVDQPPKPGQSHLPQPIDGGLLTEAEELIRSIRADLAEAQKALPNLKALRNTLPPRPTRK